MKLEVKKLQEKKNWLQAEVEEKKSHEIIKLKKLVIDRKWEWNRKIVKRTSRLTKDRYGKFQEKISIRIHERIQVNNDHCIDC